MAPPETLSLPQWPRYSRSMLLLAFLAATAVPQPGEVKTFRDWTVGCDNGLACHAVALVPEGEWEGRVTMSVRRGAEPDAALAISVEGLEEDPAALLADGRPLAARFSGGGGELHVHPSDPNAFVAALRSARQLEFRSRAGAPIGAVSLSGASAALLYMDETQRRLGTSTAFARPGGSPAAAVPPAQPLPRIRARPRPSDTRPELSAARIAQLRRQSGCTIEEVGEPDSFEAVQIETGRTLILLACGTGAYNLSSIPFIAQRRGGELAIAPAQFATGTPETGNQPGLVNAWWDDERWLLTEFPRGRGLGDCGVQSEYAWDGTAFRLVLQREMGECRGSTDFITTWRSEVVRP